MSGEASPFVTGANGEREANVPRAEIERRLRTPAPWERIREARFSLWKTEAPLIARSSRFSAIRVGALFAGCLCFLAVGGWVASRIRQGDFLLGQIFAFAVLVAIYGGGLAAVLSRRRSTRRRGPIEPPPDGIPPRALAFRASIRVRGRCVGWLWFEGDLMVFRGAGFDFRLRREDFRARGPLLRAFRGNAGVRLRGPRGISDYDLFLAPGGLLSEGFVLDPARWAALESDFRAWESGSFSREASLFPPIRPAPSVASRRNWVMFAVPPLFMGGVLGFAGWVLPIEPANGAAAPTPWALALVGATFGTMGSFLLRSSGRSGERIVREADRAARRQK